MKKSELQTKFFKEQKIEAFNSQGEPDIDYVDWLEKQICVLVPTIKEWEIKKMLLELSNERTVIRRDWGKGARQVVGVPNRAKEDNFYVDGFEEGLRKGLTLSSFQLKPSDEEQVKSWKTILKYIEGSESDKEFFSAVKDDFVIVNLRDNPESFLTK